MRLRNRERQLGEGVRLALGRVSRVRVRPAPEVLASREQDLVFGAVRILDEDAQQCSFIVQAEVFVKKSHGAFLPFMSMRTCS